TWSCVTIFSTPSWSAIAKYFPDDGTTKASHSKNNGWRSSACASTSSCSSKRCARASSTDRASPFANRMLAGCTRAPWIASRRVQLGRVHVPHHPGLVDHIGDPARQQSERLLDAVQPAHRPVTIREQQERQIVAPREPAV